MKSCACTSECGDDPNVKALLVLGCAKYRAARNPDALAAANTRLAAANARLRAALQEVVRVMDGMEPEVPDDERVPEEAWPAAKGEAKLALKETA